MLNAPLRNEDLKNSSIMLKHWATFIFNRNAKPPIIAIILFDYTYTHFEYHYGNQGKCP